MLEAIRARILPPSDLTLANVAGRAAELHGERVAFEYQDGDGDDLRTITYNGFAGSVRQLALDLAAFVEPGARVLVRVRNGMEFLACVCAVSEAGGVAVPVNSELRAGELSHVVADSGASVAIVERSCDPEPMLEAGAAEIETWVWLGAGGAVPGSGRSVTVTLAATAASDELKVEVGEEWDAASPAPDEVAAIFYTSGTTGKPKGAMLTHKGLLDDFRLLPLYPSRLRRDLLVEALPTSHIMGFLVIAGALMAGVRTRAMARFNPVEVLDAIESERASMFVGVPAMFRLMLEAGAASRDLKSVRVWASAADVMPRDLARSFQKMGASATVGGMSIGEALFVEGYGMVEYAGAATVRVSPPYLDLFGDAIGLPLPGTHLRVVDDEGREVGVGEVGEIEIRGPGTLKAYRGRSAETDEAVRGGWLRTGDLAKRGLLVNHFAGRAKDVIMSGGYSVFAVEIEEDLRRYPGVADVAVIGLPDERLGERVAAAIEVAPEEAIDLASLRTWIDDEIAEYKRPTEIILVEELPRGSTRKVQKSRVRGLFEGERAPGRSGQA